MFVAQVCRKASKVVWYLSKDYHINGYSSALDLESRIGRNGNLLVKEDFVHCDKFYIKGLFGRTEQKNEEVDFIYAEVGKEGEKNSLGN